MLRFMLRQVSVIEESTKQKIWLQPDFHRFWRTVYPGSVFLTHSSADSLLPATLACWFWQPDAMTAKIAMIRKFFMICVFDFVTQLLID